MDCCKKMFKERKKSKTQTKMKEMIKQITTRQCKPNNMGNEHNTSGLLQRNVYINKKKMETQTTSKK